MLFRECILTRLSTGHFAARPRPKEGIRAVNMQTDLRPLADLIELVFADSMDSGGHSAIRAMRCLSRMKYGLNLFSRLNELALGIRLGFVYIADGRLVGNVSIYPASYPKDLGAAWILANVAVHPAYQRRGIAHRLVDASLQMIRRRGGRQVILQVDYDNRAAQRLYEGHGFIYERAWRLWRRSSFINAPLPPRRNFHIARLPADEWRAEFALAQAVRPNSRGGLGWLMPLHKKYFHRPLQKRLLDLLAMHHTEKLVIRDRQTRQILASCWLESTVSTSTLNARFFAAPQIDHAPYAEALLHNLLARFSRSTILFEHPRDDEALARLLKRHQFILKRDLWHMRRDLA